MTLDTVVVRKSHQAEVVVFADDGLEAQPRSLELREPPITLRPLELGSGEPALFMNGFGLGSSQWPSVIAGMHAVRSTALDMSGHGESHGADYKGIDLHRRSRPDRAGT